MMHTNLDLKRIHSVFYRICLFVTWLFGRLFTDNFKFRMYESISKIGNRNKTQYVSGYHDLFRSLSKRYPSNQLESIIDVPFEDTKLPVITGWDVYLTTQYGDYMTPPKEEDRVPTHMSLKKNK